MSAPNASHYRVHGRSGMELVVVNSSILSYPRHCHVTSFIVGLVRSGRVGLVLEGRAGNFRAGEIFVIPPYRSHSLTSSRPCGMIALCLDKHLVFGSGKGSASSAARAFAGYLERAGTIDGGERARLVAAVGALAATAMDFLPGRLGPGLEALRERLEGNPENDVTLAEMAGIAHVGKFHLVRKFSRAYGMTPRRFLMLNRVRKAKADCLRRASLTKSGLEAGFYDQSHFIRNFKRLTGMTPTQFRRSHFVLGTETREGAASRPRPGSA